MILKPNKDHIKVFVSAYQGNANEHNSSISQLEALRIEPLDALLERHGISDKRDLLWFDSAKPVFCLRCGQHVGSLHSFVDLVGKCGKCEDRELRFWSGYLLGRYLCQYPHHIFNNIYNTFLGAIYTGKLDFDKLREEIKGRKAAQETLEEIFG